MRVPTSIFSLIFLLLTGTVSYSQNYKTDIKIHDKHEDTFYLFATGRGISIYSSKDMKSRKDEGSVFSKSPEWTDKVVPGLEGISGHRISRFIMVVA